MIAIDGAPAQVWPQTIAGWVGLVIAIMGLCGLLYGYMKGLAHLNGLGGRVDTVEKRQAEADARDAERLRMQDRISNTQERVSDRLSALEKRQDHYDGDNEHYSIVIGTKLDELIRSINIEARASGERLKALETLVGMLRREERE